MSACLSCGAVIDWALLPGGKRIPVDRTSAGDPSGNIAVRREGDGSLSARYLRKLALLPGEHRAVSHFATCPQAAARRGREASGG